MVVRLRLGSVLIEIGDLIHNVILNQFKRNLCSKILELRELFVFIRVLSLPFLHNTSLPKKEREKNTSDMLTV